MLGTRAVGSLVRGVRHTWRKRDSSAFGRGRQVFSDTEKGQVLTTNTHTNGLFYTWGFAEFALGKGHVGSGIL